MRAITSVMRSITSVMRSIRSYEGRDQSAKASILSCDAPVAARSGRRGDAAEPDRGPIGAPVTISKVRSAADRGAVDRRPEIIRDVARAASAHIDTPK
jgi:hypothetical protein